MPRGPAVASRKPKVVKIPVVTEMKENPTAKTRPRSASG